MLNVIIELWPYGLEETKRVVGGLQISNDGTGNKLWGNYIQRKDASEDWQPSVKMHPRNADVEELLYKVLKEKYGK